MTSTPAVEELVGILDRLRPGLCIDVSPLARAQFAYDASNYRLTPAAVAHSRDIDDVIALVREAHRLHILVTTRGSGTSMAGKAVGTGVVINMARHMNKVLAIDADTSTATVEAGAILDKLQDAVRPHGLMFGPDPSSHSRATLGGMIGNDACGNHSVAYGRTGDHVVSVDVVLADGLHVRVDNHGVQAVDPADEECVHALEARLRGLVHTHLAVLRTELDRLPRQVSGYHLHRLLPERSFDVARSVVGSEGTLAIVVAATVRLVARPRYNGLIVIGYDDVVAAAADVRTILELHPADIEGMDSSIVETTRARRGPNAVGAVPDGDAWLYVEFLEDDTEVIAGKSARLADRVPEQGRARDIKWVTEAPERAAWWRSDRPGGIHHRPASYPRDDLGK